MSTLTAVRPAPATVRWAVSDGEFENHFISSTPEPALWLTDETMRQHRRGKAPAVSVHRHDPFLGVLWDATSDGADVFTATGWPRLDDETLHLRAAVIGILMDILVADDTLTGAPFPGISDPHTWGGGFRRDFEASLYAVVTQTLADTDSGKTLATALHLGNRLQC
jgi:hypothetical protein